MITPVPGKRVLLVDDEVAVRNLYQLFLEREGLTVRTAAGVHEALQLAQDLPFDVAVVDLHLLDGNGADLIRELAREHPRLRLFAMSGYSDAERITSELQPISVSLHHKLRPLAELVRMIKN